ncbi:hypothetical protein K9L67_01030 [Candidatus Woesearchaeota archaeon]|nr:hypothetical protein [Candidatus Woesearchaeota archaeon]MCF7900787.1 hypothetical protein [Candidatus Woesearchaeota archaeon]MCF8013089.1 hypothetical protein [Candidatus Woesearchaeota archaeon]
MKSKLLAKKELRNIPEEFLNKIISDSEKENPKIYDKLKEKKFNEKSKEFKEFKKIVRKKLRVLYGVFQKETLNNNKRKKALEIFNLSSKQDKEKAIDKILKSHLSTKERLLYFHRVYSKIIDVCKKPKKIADLACGFNPFSYYFWNLEIEYFASDISKEDMIFIQSFFDISKIKGNTMYGDLTKESFQNEIVKKIKDFDTCLLLKSLDSFEALKRGSSTKLLNKISCKNIIISFPSKTISGKNIITGKRHWFQEALKQKNSAGWNIYEFEIGPEIYYLLTKS